MKKLSVIIPCFNEKKTVEKVADAVSAFVAPGWQMEIIIVDDFSDDGTREILKKYENKNGIKIIYHQKNLGKGAAMKSGISAAGGDFILIQDADLEYNPREIPKLLQAVEEKEKTVVYGSRNILPRIKNKGLFLARLGNRFLTWEFNLLFGARLTDIWTGYKLFPKEAGKYFPAGRFESELSFSAELIKRGFKIIEVPISHNPRPFSEGKKIRYADGLKAIFTLFRARF